MIGYAQRVLMSIRRVETIPGWVFGLVLSSCYVLAYLAAPLPGNIPEHPEGWWGWWDQGRYIELARAFAAGDLAPERHWYPLGYALLGAPFVKIWPAHPFFVVNIFCFLGLFWSCMGLSKACGFDKRLHPFLPFIAILVTAPAIFNQFVIPWNSTPVVFGVVTILWIVFREKALDLLSMVVLGMLAILVVACRPSDGVLLVPPAVLVLLRVMRENSLRRAAMLLGCAISVILLGLGLYLLLHYRIYGAAPSPYMVHSTRLGFSSYALAYKIYSVLIDPMPYYAEGRGIVQRIPWLVFSLVGIIRLCWRRTAAGITLASIVAINTVFYIGYADLLPYGLWRYNNIHYFLPAIIILGFVAADGLMAITRDWRTLIGHVVAIFFVTSIVLDARVAATETAAVVDDRTLSLGCEVCRNIKVLTIAPNLQAFSAVYFENNLVRQGASEWRNIFDMRTIPVADTIRTIFFSPLRNESLTLTFATPHQYSDEKSARVTYIEHHFTLGFATGWRILFMPWR